MLVCGIIFLMFILLGIMLVLEEIFRIFRFFCEDGIL